MSVEQVQGNTERDGATEAVEALRRAARDARPAEDRLRRIVSATIERTGTEAPGGRRWTGVRVAACVAAAVGVTLVFLLGPWSEHSPQPRPQPRSPQAAMGVTLDAVGQAHSYAVGRHAVVLQPGARLRVSRRDARLTEVNLSTGRARFAVAHLRPGQQFRVRAGGLRVEVVGTRFSVDRATDRCTVSVTEGTVRVVDRSGKTTLLGAGTTRVFDVSPPRSDSIETAGAPGPGLPAGHSEEIVRRALVLINTGQDPARAARLLRQYLEHNEQGLFVEEALFHLCLVEWKLGHRDAARVLARRFAREFPDSRRARRLAEVPGLVESVP